MDNAITWMKNHPTEVCIIAALVIVFVIGIWAGHVF